MTEQKKTGTSRDLPQDVLDVAHRVWLAGLGALASAQEGSDRLFHQLVDRGREMEGSGRETVRESVRGADKRVRATADNVRESARSAAEGVGDALDARVGSVLHRLGVPTRNEIKDLTHRVEELNRKIERLRTSPAAATPAPKARPAGKAASAVKAAPPSSPAGSAKAGGKGGGKTAGKAGGSKGGA
jgi:poly(hydroxyalkanoate) granule-associated protein